MESRNFMDGISLKLLISSSRRFWALKISKNKQFRNGKYDPWSIGGVNENTPGIKGGQSRGIYSFLIEGSAHHLDLRQPMSCDPATVVDARVQIVQIMNCWINPNATACPYTPHDLPAFTITDPANCVPLYHLYPWAQKSAVSGLQLSLLSLVLVIVNFI